MTENEEFKFVIPPIKFAPIHFTDDLTLVGYSYHIFSDQAETFLLYLRHTNGLMEVEKDSVIDSIVEAARQEMGIDTDDDGREEMRDILSWSRHEQFVLELLFTHLSDNFIYYLKGIVDYIFRKNPKTLKSEKTETHKFILEHETMTELRGALVDKRMQKLDTFAKLKDCFRKDFGFELFASEREYEFIDEILMLRNVLVHNNGHIDEKFMRRFSDLSKIDCIDVIEEGLAVVKINFVHLEKYGAFLVKAVADIDSRASKKFNLPLVSEL